MTEREKVLLLRAGALKAMNATAGYMSDYAIRRRVVAMFPMPKEAGVWLTMADEASRWPAPGTEAVADWQGLLKAWRLEASVQRDAVVRLMALVEGAFEEGRISHDYEWKDSNSFYELATLCLPEPPSANRGPS